MNLNFKNINIQSKIGFKFSIASPLQILKWSWKKIDSFLITGQITEPYTLNYKTGIPEPNGLFCERIFGPIKSWQCNCGYFNKNNPIFEAHICSICGYENNNSILRRYRMGYIYLKSPIAHSWYLKHLIPSFLGVSYETIHYLLYYLFLDDLLNEKNKIKFNEKYNITQYIFASNYIQQNLNKLNLIQEYLKFKENLYITFNLITRKKLIKLINFLNLFILNNISPSWLMLDILPVIPAGIRPLLYTNSNNIVVSPLNEVYRLIILKNNRLKRWSKLRNLVPITFEVVEKRKIQQLVDILLETSNNVNNNNSLTSILKGKYNHFRQYILGKRVDFSGRSVIVSGPDLNIGNIGLSFALCINIFKPLLLNFLKKNKSINTILRASNFIDYSPLVLKRLLTYILNKEVVMINRAPTLHRMNIQAFKPSLVENESIKLFPLACSGFNADFDGDQMGIFLILSNSAKKEAKLNMLFEKNIFSPSYTKNIFKFSQNIVLGLNNLLSIRGDSLNKFIFNSVEDALKSLNHKLIKIDTLILIKSTTYKSKLFKSKKKYICTTLGRLLINNLN